MGGFRSQLFSALRLFVVLGTVSGVLPIQHGWAQEIELEIPPGDVRARVGAIENTIPLLDPQDISIAPRLLIGSSGEITHAFGKDGPFSVTVPGAQDYSEPPPAYGLKFAVSPTAGSGAIVSSDPAVISVVKQDFSSEDADSGGVITRRLVTGQPGTARLTITWNCCAQGGAGQSVSVDVDVTVTPIDLSIAGVPDFAEYDVGGFVEAGKLVELQLRYPTGRVPDLPDAWNIYTLKNVELTALKGGERIRIWQDRAKTQEVTLPFDLDAQSGPRRLFLEPTSPSENVRDIELRLSVAGLVSLHGWDTVALTAVEIALETRSDLIGQNDDDDNTNNEKDILETAAAVAGEDDLLPLVVRVRPFLRTFGRRSVEISAGLGLWGSQDKGAAALLIDGLNNARGLIDLDGTAADRTLYLEGIAPLAPATVTLALSPELLVAGSPVSIGPTLTEKLDFTVVKADIDIAGIPDDRDDEFTIGGKAYVIGGEPPPRDRMTELRLRVSPDGFAPRSARLAVPRGAEHVRLWMPRTDDAEDRDNLIELKLRDNGGEPSADFLPPPSQVYVQGLTTSDERGVEISLTLYADGDSRERIHRDRIALTVRSEGDQLTLAPTLIVAPRSLADEPETVPLELVLSDAEGNEVARVERAPETTYEWVHNGLAGLAELPVAGLEMDTPGVLRITSGGVQLIRAKHGDLVSNTALVLAGIKLKSIEISPESLVSTPLGAAIENPPLVLTSENNEFIANHGLLWLTDVELEVLHSGATFSLTDLAKTVSGVAQAIPQVKFLQLALKGLNVLGQAMIEFESADPSVAATGSPNGHVSGAASGITGVKGTLELEGLGSADDTVMAIVLPELDRVEIRAESDAAGEHETPLMLRRSQGWELEWVSGHASTRTIARAAVPLGKSFENYDENLDAILPGGTEAFSHQQFDLALPLPTPAGLSEFRIRGHLQEIEDKENASTVVFQEVVINFPVHRSITQTWRTLKPAVARVEPERRKGDFSLALSPAPGIDVGATRVIVDITVPGLGSASGMRRVEVQAGACEAAPPILRFGRSSLPSEPDSIMALDQRFAAPDEDDSRWRIAGAPFAAAVGMFADRIGGPVQRIGPVGPRRGSPERGVWVYFVEVPVNDPSRCDLHLQRSTAEGEDEALSNVSYVEQRGFGRPLEYTIGRYAHPVDGKAYALVDAGFWGWTDGARGERRVGGIWDRLSVFDIGSMEYRATALYGFRLLLDGKNHAPPLFRSELIGSSSGLVDPSFRPEPPPDAAMRLRGLPNLSAPAN